MLFRRCEWCGKEEQVNMSDEDFEPNVTMNIQGDHKSFDLCKACARKLRDYITEQAINKRGD